MGKFYRSFLNTLFAGAIGIASLSASAEAYVSKYFNNYLNPTKSYEISENIEYAQRRKPVSPARKKTGKAKNIPKSGGSLRGSRASMNRQNTVANNYNLSRIENNEQLDRMVRNAYLIKVEMKGKGYYLADDIIKTRKYHKNDPPLSRNFSRQFSTFFLYRFASQYNGHCDEPLRISSLVRTKEDNLHIPNASKRSAHLTGATIDIARNGMCGDGLRWVRGVLSNLEKQGYIEATEERNPPHFHVMVFPNYPDYVNGLARAHTRSGKRR